MLGGLPFERVSPELKMTGVLVTVELRSIKVLTFRKQRRSNLAFLALLHNTFDLRLRELPAYAMSLRPMTSFELLLQRYPLLRPILRTSSLEELSPPLLDRNRQTDFVLLQIDNEPFRLVQSRKVVTEERQN